MNARSLRLIPMLAVLTALGARAEITPTPSQKDPHVQSVRPEGDVIRLVTAEGVYTTIELHNGETIENHGFGDPVAWHARREGSRFALRPAAKEGSCNLTLYTVRPDGTKGKYLFSVKVLRKPTREVAYWLDVEGIPPPPPVAGAAAGGSAADPAPSPEVLAAQRRVAERRQVDQAFADAKYQGRQNTDFTIVGPVELEPLAARDNGIFTYLTFNAAYPLPAPFWIEADGTESIADYHMDKDGATMVLHRVHDRLVLRRGDLVAGITNHAVHRSAQPSPTGTTSDAVRRVIRAESEN